MPIRLEDVRDLDRVEAHATRVANAFIRYWVHTRKRKISQEEQRDRLIQIRQAGMRALQEFLEGRGPKGKSWQEVVTDGCRRAAVALFDRREDEDGESPVPALPIAPAGSGGGTAVATLPARDSDSSSGETLAPSQFDHVYRGALVAAARAFEYYADDLYHRRGDIINDAVNEGVLRALETYDPDHPKQARVSTWVSTTVTYRVQNIARSARKKERPLLLDEAAGEHARDPGDFTDDAVDRLTVAWLDALAANPWVLTETQRAEYFRRRKGGAPGDTRQRRNYSTALRKLRQHIAA